MTDRPPRDEAELIELLRSVDEPAPRELHERVQAMVDERRRLRLPRLELALGAGVAAAAAIAVVVALVLSGGGGGASGPTLEQASSPTLAAATLPAPVESPSARGQLTAAVEGVAFPESGFMRVSRVGY